MDLKKISGVIDKLKLVQGIERDLLKYKRKSTIGAIFGGIVVIFGFLSQMLKPILDILDKGIKKEIFEKFSGHILIGTILLIIGFIVFWLSKRTSLLYKESEEPFRYSFWIEPFKRIKIKGRTDSMITIGSGDNIFPNSFDDVILGITSVINYQIILERKNNKDLLKIFVESKHKTDKLKSQIENVILKLRSIHNGIFDSKTILKPEIKIVKPNTIDKNSIKSRRIIDNRKLYD